MFINKTKRKIKWLYPLFRNKYFLASLFFLVWLSFFDKNDFISQYKYRCELRQLNADRQYYIDELKKNKEDLKNLMGSPANLEKFAREKYFMKKDDEDIFIIVYNEPVKEENFF